MAASSGGRHGPRRCSDRPNGPGRPAPKAEIRAAQFDKQRGLGLDLRADDLLPEALAHRQRRAGLGGESLGLGMVRGQRQHHGHRQLAPSQATNTPPAAASPESTAWVYVTCGWATTITARSASGMRDLGQVLALDDQLRIAARGGARAPPEKSRMRLIIGRKDISQGVYDHLPCFGLAEHAGLYPHPGPCFLHRNWAALGMQTKFNLFPEITVTRYSGFSGSISISTYSPPARGELERLVLVVLCWTTGWPRGHVRPRRG